MEKSESAAEFATRMAEPIQPGYAAFSTAVSSEEPVEIPRRIIDLGAEVASLADVVDRLRQRLQDAGVLAPGSPSDKAEQILSSPSVTPLGETLNTIAEQAMAVRFVVIDTLGRLHI